MVTVHLVTGPPCGGKTTWVNQRRQPGDIVIDYDELAAALGGVRHQMDQPIRAVVNAARDAAIQAATNGRGGNGDVYLISANPRADEMYAHDELQLIDPGISVAVARARASRPAGYESNVRAWYQARQSRPKRRRHRPRSVTNPKTSRRVTI